MRLVVAVCKCGDGGRLLTHGEIVMAKKLELLANLAIVCLSLVLGAALLRNNFGTTSGAGAAPAGISVGDKIGLSSVDWNGPRPTVVLALQTTCHFCTESAPFYQRLTTEAKRRGVRVIAVFPTATPNANEYLTQLRVDIPDIKFTDFSQLRVRGTPTVLIVDKSGLAKKVWTGKLNDSAEQEVLKILADFKA
jgi:hypothetical protein